jgi:hypothetical protein
MNAHLGTAAAGQESTGEDQEASRRAVRRLGKMGRSHQEGEDFLHGENCPTGNSVQNRYAVFDREGEGTQANGPAVTSPETS